MHSANRGVGDAVDREIVTNLSAGVHCQGEVVEMAHDDHERSIVDGCRRAGAPPLRSPFADAQRVLRVRSVRLFQTTCL